MSIQKLQRTPGANRVGRKKLPPGEKKAVNLIMRLSLAEKKKLTTDAKRAGFKKVSSYVRAKLGLGG
jgi:hypothetical protein